MVRNPLSLHERPNAVLGGLEVVGGAGDGQPLGRLRTESLLEKRRDALGDLVEKLVGGVSATSTKTTVALGQDRTTGPATCLKPAYADDTLTASGFDSRARLQDMQRVVGSNLQTRPATIREAGPPSRQASRSRTSRRQTSSGSGLLSVPR